MDESRIKPSSDLRRIGSSMVRAKYQRGSLKKIANGQYVARWRRYSATPSGEKATPRKKIITKELAAKYRIGTDYTARSRSPTLSAFWISSSLRIPGSI